MSDRPQHSAAPMGVPLYQLTKNISNVCKHFKTVHGGNLESFLRSGTGEKICWGGWRGDTHHTLLQRGVWWIHRLNTRFPSGMNSEMDENLFLKYNLIPQWVNFFPRSLVCFHFPSPLSLVLPTSNDFKLECTPFFGGMVIFSI